MTRILLFCTVASLLLAACDQMATQNIGEPPVANGSDKEGTAKTGESASQTGLKIGQNSVPGEKATDIFVEVCIKQASPASLGMKQNASSKTWYHQSYDLMVEQSPKSCRVVFGNSDEPPLQVGTLLTVASTMATSDTDSATVILDPNTGAGRTTGNGKQFTFDPVGKSGGRNKYAARLFVK